MAAVIIGIDVTVSQFDCLALFLLVPFSPFPLANKFLVPASYCPAPASFPALLPSLTLQLCLLAWRLKISLFYCLFFFVLPPPSSFPLSRIPTLFPPLTPPTRPSIGRNSVFSLLLSVLILWRGREVKKKKKKKRGAGGPFLAQA